jgi:hypothetical protein
MKLNKFSLMVAAGLMVSLVLAGGPSTAAEKEAEADVPIFLEMKGFLIPVIKNGAVEKYVQIKVTLEMTDGKSKSLAEASFPRLKDGFYRALHDYFGFQRAGTKGINVRIVKARLMRAGAKAIGKNKIKAVLIQGAIERGSSGK